MYVFCCLLTHANTAKLNDNRNHSQPQYFYVYKVTRKNKKQCKQEVSTIVVIVHERVGARQSSINFISERLKRSV